MKDDSSYVHVLRTDQTALGVFAEESAALAHEAHFEKIHREMFPDRAIPKVHLDRRVVIGGTAKGGTR